MLSSRPLEDVFVSRVSQTRDNIRGVKGSMLSSRLYRVSQTRDNKRAIKSCLLYSRLLDHVYATLYTTYIVSGLNHTGHEHMI
jgi:hypothetical protein